jgi:hypothetical protein
MFQMFQLFQTYVASVYLDVAMLHMFQTYVASVYSRCFIVLDLRCKCVYLDIGYTYVANICLQMFHLF